MGQPPERQILRIIWCYTGIDDKKKKRKKKGIVTNKKIDFWIMIRIRYTQSTM